MRVWHVQWPYYWTLRTCLLRSWTAYTAARRLRGRPPPWTQSDPPDVVLEGFPRSGNTVLYHLLRAARPAGTRIRHAAHAPCRMRAAGDLQPPVCVPLRDPREVLPELRRKMPMLRADDVLRAYACFHTSVLRQRDTILIVETGTLFGHPGAVLAAVSRATGRAFRLDRDPATFVADYRTWERRQRDAHLARLGGRVLATEPDALPDSAAMRRCLALYHQLRRHAVVARADD